MSKKKIFKSKRIYQKKVENQILLNKDFLMERLKEEWDEIQREAKKEQIIRMAKAGGLTMCKVILGLLAVGGLLTVAAIAPNIFGAYGRLNNRRGFFEKKQFNQAKKYLRDQKYIKVVPGSRDGLEVQITDRGFRYILKDTFRNLHLNKMKKWEWDGFWRIVIFDIPDKHKWAREGFREKLKSLGFYPLQESVFIMPYPCEKEINFLVSVFNISNFVYLLKSRDLSDNKELKKIFNLA